MKQADVIEARVAREQQWIYDAHIAGYTKPRIRALALEPVARGGLGRAVSMSEIRTAIDEVRTAQGSIIGTREERIEKRHALYDDQILLALAARQKAAELGTIDVQAEKLLLDVLAAQGRMHGDDAALRVEAEVTTRDAVTDELNAMLARLGVDETIEAQP